MATLADLPKLKEDHGTSLHAFIVDRDVHFYGADANIASKRLGIALAEPVDGNAHLVLRRDLWTDYCTKLLNPPIPILDAAGNQLSVQVDGKVRKLSYDVCQNC